MRSNKISSTRMMFISIEITEFEKCMGNWKNFTVTICMLFTTNFALLEIPQFLTGVGYEIRRTLI